ncbi:hypothetical protein MTR_7g034030 [Medicago truncatula]|uniref:Uncharacterized protein n=1 Tax=Medicago truncatula TaxID=3880 RepID=A0A072TXL2_MEDTR|nr:hypothetical protein MTR_7g034030 [Medicago truncatula]
MDQLEQEVHELRKEVTTLRAKVKELTNRVSSLMVTKDLPQFQQRSHPPHQLSCTQQPQPQAPQQSNPQNQAWRARYDPIPVKYGELLPIFLEKNLVQTRAPPRVHDKLPAGYRSDLSCAFHQGAPDHDIEHCYTLKAEIQKLVQAKKN